MKRKMKMRWCLLCLPLSGVTAGTAEEVESSPTDWNRVVDDIAMKNGVFMTDSRSASLDGVETMLPNLSLGRGVDGDAALILFSALDGELTKWAYSHDGNKDMKEVGGKHGTPLPPGGRFVTIYSAANGERIQMIYSAPSKDARSSFTITFFKFDEIKKSVAKSE